MNRIDLDYADYETVSKRQTVLLKTTLQYLALHSEYYQSVFNKKRIQISRFNSMEDLAGLPITTKADLLQNNPQFFCSVSPSDTVMTSGSTGARPIVHPLTALDLRRLAYNEQVSFQTAGIHKGDTVMLATALDGSFVAGLAYYLGLREIGCNILRTGAKNYNLQMNMIARGACNAIIGVPSNLLRLSSLCGDNGASAGLSCVNKLVLIGESIRKADFTLNQLGQRLSRSYLNAGLYSTYANTETCSSFCECKAGQGGHLSPELAYAEIVDENGQRVPDETPGRLLLTTFGAHGMPLLRYDTGDITFKCSGPCSCGRTSTRIGPILSRTNTLFKIHGITFSQAQVEELLLAESCVLDYCVVVNKGQENTRSMTVWISSGHSDEKEQSVSKIKARIWDNIRINADVRICDEEKLKNLQASTGARKPVRFLINKGPGEDEQL